MIFKEWFKSKPYWLKGIIIIIIIIILINIFDFNGATKIKVIDIVTNKPVQNIDVEQLIQRKVFTGFHDGYVSKSFRTLTKKTDSEGNVWFPPTLYMHAPFPFTSRFAGENIFVSTKDRDGKYYGSSRNYYLGHLLPFKSATVNLTPVVNNLSECKKNTYCISKNAFDLALLNNDESYCEYVGLDFRTHFPNSPGMINQEIDCYFIIALSKKDINLCNKFFSSSEYNKEECKKKIEENPTRECYRVPSWGHDRGIKACRNLFKE